MLRLQQTGTEINASVWYRPAVPDSWLDWLPEYDMPLGKPTGPATSVPSTSNITGLLPGKAHVWSWAPELLGGGRGSKIVSESHTHTKLKAVEEGGARFLNRQDPPLLQSLHDSAPKLLRAGQVWSRSFASGTSVVFDGGSGQGTIKWAHGKTQVGLPYTNVTIARQVAAAGCRWEDV